MQLSLYILKLSIFSCQVFCNSCSFALFHFLLSVLFSYCYFPPLHTFFSVSVKPIQNVVVKKSVARNIVSSKNISFSGLCETRFSCAGELRSNVKILISNLAESVIMTNRLNLVQYLPAPCKYFEFTRFLYKIYFK